ncbi:fibrinogen-like protein A [Mytilus edulis]|uniref:fibrinogen-like protein A n=1 Tax=Mytilus edulis TaxID=6550 RepID=UPI0039F11320
MNSIVVVVAFCVFWYGDIFVTSLDTSTEDIGDTDPLSMPLITDKGTPLVAMLDTKSINRKMKIYIQTLMRNTVKNYEKEQTQRFKTLLEGNSTAEFFRNITLQEINDVLKDKEKDQLVNPFRNEEENKQDCGDILKSNPKAKSGVFLIFPDKKTAVRVYCDMDTVQNGWTIIQRRLDGTVNFQRTWTDYENGFGDPYGEYWFGNKHIHSLTSSGTYELRIDLTDLSHTKKYAAYKTFVVGDAASKYKLTVGDYSGNAGDQMTYHNGMKFSPTDQDNDEHGGHMHCVDNYGPWWHKSCCHSALNRKLNMNLYWRNFRSNAAKTSVMMIRKL